MSQMHQFLQEIEATILVTDVRGFTALANSIGPVDLGLALSSYYNHVGGIAEKHGGRIVKFIGDSMLSCFIGGDHRGKALAAIAEMARHREGWLADNAKVKLPRLDYVASAASGEVLTGELGTNRIRFWDVLGASVNLAFRLCSLATERQIPNLVDASTVDTAAQKPDCVEVDPAELGGQRHRLFRISE